MYPPVAIAVPMAAKSDSRNIDQPIMNPNHGPTARRPYANGPPANGIATDNSDRDRTQAMYRAQTNSEASSMPIGPASPSPPFQPKYSPVMTAPTPSAQMCGTPIGFLSVCSLRYSRSSGRRAPTSRWASLTTCSTTWSSSERSPTNSSACRALGMEYLIDCQTLSPPLGESQEKVSEQAL